MEPTAYTRGTHYPTCADYKFARWQWLNYHCYYYHSLWCRIARVNEDVSDSRLMNQHGVVLPNLRCTVRQYADAKSISLALEKCRQCELITGRYGSFKS